jgi:hypothetical protein
MARVSIGNDPFALRAQGGQGCPRTACAGCPALRLRMSALDYEPNARFFINASIFGAIFQTLVD